MTPNYSPVPITQNNGRYHTWDRVNSDLSQKESCGFNYTEVRVLRHVFIERFLWWCLGSVLAILQLSLPLKLAHSALEMALQLFPTFIHLWWGLPDFLPLKFTHYNQYESLVNQCKKISGNMTYRSVWSQCYQYMFDTEGKRRLQKPLNICKDSNERQGSN